MTDRRVAALMPLHGRMAALVAALLLAIGLTLAPPTARPAAAATGRLLTAAVASYTLDPSAGVVRVSVAVTLKNDKPSDATYFYFWRDLSWGVHPDATNIRVRDAAGNLRVTPRPGDGFIDAEFRLRRDLLYRQSSQLTISWDLAGGAPRSDSTIRAGEAFAAFDLWAWGDAGSSSVIAHLPRGFEAKTFGSEVATTSGPEGVTLTADAIADPVEFWAAVTAVRERSYASQDLTLPGDIAIRVRGWPEDEVWRITVSSTLRRGLPELQDLVGLPWPISQRVDVTEVYAPLLEGYSGIFYTDLQRIEISEQLDDLTIVHEGSHAWFNDDLFSERWITEGLADTYAAAVLVRLGEARQSPDVPRPDDDGRVDLLSWTFPGRVTDETEARELYGYNASWYIVNELFEEVGPERLRSIFRAAHDDTIAYVGVGAPESVPGADDWRRFLDLLEEVGGSSRAETLVREFVVDLSADRELDARTVARAAYSRLLETGAGWLPPIYVRAPMGSWSFDRATGRIEEATAILDLRDEIQVLAGGLGLEPDGTFETAYDSAESGFQQAEATGQEHLDALEVLTRAHDAVAVPPDVVAWIGLLGVTPGAAYDEAAAAFETGDLDRVHVVATVALALIDDAPRIGLARLALAGIVIGAAVLILIALVLRRRSRRVPAGQPPPAEPAAEGGPYATLAADSPAPPPGADGAAGPEGGTVDGEGSSTAT